MGLPTIQFFYIILPVSSLFFAVSVQSIKPQLVLFIATFLFEYICSATNKSANDCVRDCYRPKKTLTSHLMSTSKRLPFLKLLFFFLSLSLLLSLLPLSSPIFLLTKKAFLLPSFIPFVSFLLFAFRFSSKNSYNEFVTSFTSAIGIEKTRRGMIWLSSSSSPSPHLLQTLTVPRVDGRVLLYVPDYETDGDHSYVNHVLSLVDEKKMWGVPLLNQLSTSPWCEPSGMLEASVEGFRWWRAGGKGSVGGGEWELKKGKGGQLEWEKVGSSETGGCSSDGLAQGGRSA